MENTISGFDCEEISGVFENKRTEIFTLAQSYGPYLWKAVDVQNVFGWFRGSSKEEKKLLLKTVVTNPGVLDSRCRVEQPLDSSNPQQLVSSVQMKKIHELFFQSILQGYYADDEPSHLEQQPSANKRLKLRKVCHDEKAYDINYIRRHNHPLHQDLLSITNSRICIGYLYDIIANNTIDTATPSTSSNATDSTSAENEIDKEEMIRMWLRPLMTSRMTSYLHFMRPLRRNKMISLLQNLDDDDETLIKAAMQSAKEIYFSSADSVVRSTYASELYDRFVELSSSIQNQEEFIKKLLLLSSNDIVIQEVVLLMLLEPHRRRPAMTHNNEFKSQSTLPYLRNEEDTFGNDLCRYLTMTFRTNVTWITQQIPILIVEVCKHYPLLFAKQYFIPELVTCAVESYKMIPKSIATNDSATAKFSNFISDQQLQCDDYDKKKMNCGGNPEDLYFHSLIQLKLLLFVSTDSNSNEDTVSRNIGDIVHQVLDAMLDSNLGPNNIGLPQQPIGSAYSNSSAVVSDIIKFLF
jgi:hypothetical protein